MTRIDVAGLLTGTVLFAMLMKWAEFSWHFSRFAELLWRKLP